MKTADEYIKCLRSYMDSHATDMGIRTMGIFGSVARGEQNEKSDLDVVIDISNPDYFILSNIQSDLEILCDCKVDLVHLHKYMRPTFIKHIQEDAIMA